MKRYQQNTEILSSKMDGEIVMMDIDDGTYYSISSGVGAHIWEAIKEPATVKEIVEKIRKVFKVDAKVCEQDVNHFIASLSEQNLVKETG